MGRDVRAHASVAIGQMRGHLENALTADLHTHQPNVPALDNAPRANHTLEGLTALE